MLLWIKISANSRRNSVGRVRMIDEGRHTKVSFSSVFLHTGSFAQNFFQTDLIKRCTCKSLSEALILASTNPQYDKYMKIPSSKHVYTNCFPFLFWHSEQFMYTTCSELGIFMYWTRNSMNNLLSYYGLVDARISASEKDLPVPIENIFNFDS